ncbi:hypothetical protein JCM1840_001131 [Sporobolomyces johnsonii]
MEDNESDYSSASDSERPAPSTSAANPSNPSKAKGKGKAAPGNKRGKGEDAKEVRRRSSKACDNCRKSKCKCTRILDPATNEPVGPCQNCLTVGAECTYLGASRKRGPPKGYIEAIESRLHRMEALLGGLLQTDDPRAQTLLGELIGDSEARDMLARDLKAATAPTADGKPPKSWKREFAAQQEALARQQQKQSTSHAPAGSGGFPEGATFSGATPAEPPRWMNEEDLGFGGGNAILGVSPGGSGQMNLLGVDPSTFSAGMGQYRGPGMESSSDSGSPAFLPGTSTAGAMDYSLPAPPQHQQPSSLPSAMSMPIPMSHPGLTSQPSNSAATELGSSPRQRRRLDPPANSPPADERKQMAYAFTLPPVSGPNRSSSIPASIRATAGGPILPATAIAHTGQSTYTLSTDLAGVESAFGGAGDESSSAGRLRDVGGAGKGRSANGVTGQAQAQEGPDSELADVIGQLSLNENAEVRYHGRSSGLYLISKSQRFRDFFWQFPSAGVWPPAEGRVHKTEREILQLADAEDPLPDLETQHHLLQAYWTYVHPHFPILYKVSFMRQYRHWLANRNSTEQSTAFGTGPVPMVLLLTMFGLAARYCDLDEARKDGKYWTAGQEYLDKARRILNHDYGSSKLVTVQALLLISYREIGTGAMSSAWMSAGMAIRMAQDLGLFRDVEKWFLPVQRFTHEEKQTRKRIWWGCIILDRYTSSYIGRPGTIHERDYDTGFCSEDEPDEHEQWRPIRLDGTDWPSPPKNPDSQFPEEIAKTLQSYPATRANTLSCFNAAAALAVIINRIISNVYAIRIRVLGQSSETLLSLLDQSLASWYLALPPHLAYNPAAKKVPAPHILALHLQFYSSLILLHRPFIPGQNSAASPGNFPSHSICTTSANAIANIITTWRKTFTLRQCPPFVTYPIFSAAIICVYNASFDEALARPAKLHLLQCLNALKEMELIWGSAIRAWELLHGLVDLRDAELSAELDGLNAAHAAEEATRGTKRPTMDIDEPSSSAFADVRPTNFHNRSVKSQPQANRRRGSSVSNAASSMSGRTGGDGAAAILPAPVPTPGGLGSSSAPQFPSLFPLPPREWQLPVTSMHSASTNAPHPAPAQQSAPPQQPSQGMFSHEPPSFGLSPSGSGQNGEAAAQTFDILNPSLDLSQFRSPPGTSGGVTNFSDLLNSFLSPTEAASMASGATATPATAPPVPTGTPFDPTSAFFGMPLGAGMTEDWYNYSFNAFGQGDSGSVPSGGGGESSMSPEGGSHNPSSS